jgi:hypothetical protein
VGTNDWPQMNGSLLYQPGGAVAAPQPPGTAAAATRPRSSSRSAPTTPRQFEWGSSMPYYTAPVSPHYAYGSDFAAQQGGADFRDYYRGQHNNNVTADADVVGAGREGGVPGEDFPATPDLVYSAPGAFSLEDEDDRLGNMPKQAEHPSRTLFVRNLPNDTDPLALQSEFEQFGPVRSIYANCKYRGFVMISFFDIRHSKAAMLVLNGKKVQGKKMDVHYALPKDNAGDKEANQGTLVVFNLDTSMSDDDIRAVFSDYGEVKDIRSTPNKNTHKFVEFYDVRDAERALLALNRTKVRSKVIKIEVSRPSNRGRRKESTGFQPLQLMGGPLVGPPLVVPQPGGPQQGLPQGQQGPPQGGFMPYGGGVAPLLVGQNAHDMYQIQQQMQMLQMQQFHLQQQHQQHLQAAAAAAAATGATRSPSAPPPGAMQQPPHPAFGFGWTDGNNAAANNANAAAAAAANARRHSTAGVTGNAHSTF